MTAQPVVFDPFEKNKETGSFILVDRYSNQTVGAGTISFRLMRGDNLHAEALAIDKSARARAKNQRPCVLWFTGLSGAGKSTIARLVEAKLHLGSCHTYMLDGDNIRRGLNHDLGFTVADRIENIRRVGEVSKLFVDAGLIVLCSFISPFRAERQTVRDFFETDEFIEIFVDTSLEECMRRDPKGLYAKAKAGELKNFTGIDSGYEPPECPDLRLTTNEQSADDLANAVMGYLKRGGYIH
jgi:bifunctional enzyme CysN/CysC